MRENNIESYLDKLKNFKRLYKMLILFLLLVICYELHNYLTKNILQASSEVIAVAFSANGKLIAVATREKVDLWNVEARKRVKRFDPGGHLTAIQFSPNGKFLATARDGCVALWSVEEGKEIIRLPLDFVDSLSFSLDGELLAIGHVSHHGDASIILMSVNTGECLTVLPIWGYRFAVFHPDSKWLVAIPAWNRVRPQGGGIEILKLEKTQEKYTLECEKILGRDLNRYGPNFTDVFKKATYIALSPDGKIMVSIHEDDEYRIRMWSVETGEELRSLDGHTAMVNSVAFSPNGKFLVSGGADHTIRVWCVKTGEEIKVGWRHRGEVKCISISPDGKLLVSGGTDQKAKIWDLGCMVVFLDS